MGWGIEQVGASKYIYHGGNNVAFKGAAFACPEKREGLVYLTNSEGGMTIESALVNAIEGGDHPGLFSETEPYTSPRWVARAELIRLFMQDNLDDALRRYRELKLSMKLQFRTNPNGDPAEVVVSKIPCA